MSYYSLAVILKREDLHLKDIEEAIQEKMIKYCEDIELLPKQYVKFKDCTEDVQDYMKQNNLSYKEAMNQLWYEDNNGVPGYYYNENAKYDWYTMGGTWSNLLHFKDGTTGDWGTIDEIDFSNQTDFHTYAVLDENGWHEPNKMKWFGISDASKQEKQDFIKNYYKNFISNQKGDTVIAILDCHI